MADGRHCLTMAAIVYIGLLSVGELQRALLHSQNSTCNVEIDDTTTQLFTIQVQQTGLVIIIGTPST